MSRSLLRTQQAASLLVCILVPLAAAGQAGRTRLDAHRSLGAAHTYRNLTLIPVYDSTAKTGAQYLTLDEGMKAKSVTVAESPQGGDVNTLYVTNRGEKPLYLLAGEVVLGGQQDRCVGRDTIVQPHAKRMPLSVFCVEHGRWSGQHDFDSSAPAIASGSIRASAQDGVFKEERVLLSMATPRGGAAGMAGRDAGRGRASEEVSQAQQKVWAKVEEKNRAFKAPAPTGSYRGVLTGQGGESGHSVAPYLKALAVAADGDAHLVGMVAAVNGKPVAMDVFHDPALFRKLWPKLLRSYAADAAEQASAGNVKPVSAAAARDFYVGATDGRAREVNRTSAGTTMRLESGSAVTYRLLEPSPKPQALHENILRK